MAERVVLFHVFDHILLLRCWKQDILPDVVFLFWAFTVHLLRSRRRSPGVRHICAVDFASITSFGREAVAVQVASVGDTSVVRSIVKVIHPYASPPQYPPPPQHLLQTITSQISRWRIGTS